MSVKMIDIAKKLNVTTSTVSLALRDSPKISAKTIKLVKETAEEMGYHVNPYVSALMSFRRSGKTPEKPPCIAFITSSATEDGWKEMYNAREFYEGCSEVVQSLGIHLEIFWIGAPKISTVRLNKILYSRGIRGAILLPTGIHREKLDHEWENIATVSYGIYEISPETDQVKADFYSNMEKTLRILKDLGFTRIGYVMDIPFPYDKDNQWLAAYYLYRHRLKEKDKLAPYLEPKPSLATFSTWVKGQKPEVIICKNQERVNDWLNRMGYAVPTDMSLVSLGTTSEGRSFTGIMENAATSGHIAMEMLLDRIHRNQFGTPRSPRFVTLRGHWNPGETLAPPRASHHAD